MISDLQPKWTTVRGIGNSFPAKLSLAMPVIGYIILFNDVVVSIFKSNMHATSPMINGMFWNLYYYYFGLFSFGIASSIYYLFCSRLVRDYISFQSYYEAEAEDISPTEITEICNNLAKEKAPGFEKTLAIRALSESTGKKVYWKHASSYVLTLSERE